jgi:hypothetical protein
LLPILVSWDLGLALRKSNLRRPWVIRDLVHGTCHALSVVRREDTEWLNRLVTGIVDRIFYIDTHHHTKKNEGEDHLYQHLVHEKRDNKEIRFAIHTLINIYTYIFIWLNDSTVLSSTNSVLLSFSFVVTSSIIIRNKNKNNSQNIEKTSGLLSQPTSECWFDHGDYHEVFHIIIIVIIGTVLVVSWRSIK